MNMYINYNKVLKKKRGQKKNPWKKTLSYINFISVSVSITVTNDIFGLPDV